MESHATNPAAGAHKSPPYMLIFLVLFVLTLTEVGVAFLSHIPKQYLILILLAPAVWKAALVAMYYMHLKFEPRRLWLLAISPLPLAVILVVIVLSEGW